MRTACILLFVAAGGVVACGGAARPGTRTPSGGEPVAADPSLSVDCPAACARLKECAAAPSASCEADCRGGAGDDASRSRWACWSSSQTCVELAECDTAAD